MRRVLMTLILLLAVFATSSAAQEDDFQEVPSGATLLLPSGDSLVVGQGSYLVSDSALVRLDSTLRDVRGALRVAEGNLEDRQEQVEALTPLVDSLRVSLAGERAWRSAASELLGEGTPAWAETLENFGLAAGGFAVCRMTEARR